MRCKPLLRSNIALIQKYLLCTKSHNKNVKNIFYNIAKTLRHKSTKMHKPQLIMNNWVWMISLPYVLSSFKIDSHLKNNWFFLFGWKLWKYNILKEFFWLFRNMLIYVISEYHGMDILHNLLNHYIWAQQKHHASYKNWNGWEQGKNLTGKLPIMRWFAPHIQ